MIPVIEGMFRREYILHLVLYDLGYHELPYNLYFFSVLKQLRNQNITIT